MNLTHRRPRERERQLCCPRLSFMDFIERCFVAMTVAGFIGIVAVLIWMWLT
jgi:hypothetical protein